MTPKQIEKKYESFTNRRMKLVKDQQEFKEFVVSICHHPEKYLHRWQDDADDGYGRWWKVNHCSCLVCGKTIH